MSNPAFPYNKANLAYAKLVATPTETSWSQVYNAGNLFACVSLTLDEASEDTSLPALGKKVLDTLQAEFYSLDNKTLPSISEVIEHCVKEAPEGVIVDMTVSFFKDNILYIFIKGRGRVLMKREGKIGKLLEGTQNDGELHTASGYLKNDDTVILESKQFAADITDETLSSALELPLPNDIAEALSPQMHAKDDGGQAAIIVVYHGAGKIPHEEALVHDEPQEAAHANVVLPRDTDQQENQEKVEEDEVGEEAFEDDQEVEKQKKRIHFSMPELPSLPFLTTLTSKLVPSGFKLSHTRKLFLSIVIVLIVLLAASIMFTKKKQADAEQRQQFLAVYEPAQKKYDEGKAIWRLNEQKSYENFVEAKKLLTENSNAFPSGSAEGKQIQELLAKVDAELAAAGPTENANTKEVSVNDNSLLAVAKANKDAKGFTQDDSTVYYLTDTAIVSVSKSSGKKTDIIKNDKAWEDGVGVATYQGNFYVLDRKKGIIKFVAGGGGYGASSYFKDKPNLASARDLAIDSSIWILLQEGTVLKYTSGVSDGYKAPKLEKNMSTPAKIFTDASTSNVYILDKGNSRVISLQKEGSGHKEYKASIIGQAREFEVKEKDKKINILSGDKVYEINL